MAREARVPVPEALSRSRLPRGSLGALRRPPSGGSRRSPRPRQPARPALGSFPGSPPGARAPCTLPAPGGAAWGHGAPLGQAHRHAGDERGRVARPDAREGRSAARPGTPGRPRDGRREGGGGAGAAGGRRAPSASGGRLGLAGDAGGHVVQRVGVRHPERLRGALRVHAEDLRVRGG